MQFPALLTRSQICAGVQVTQSTGLESENEYTVYLYYGKCVYLTVFINTITVSA